MTNNEIVQKLWNLCNVLRDDGITYHEYVTELTYILFLKMLAEQDNEAEVGIPEEYRWNTLIKLDGLELKTTYQKALIDLAQKENNLAIIYRNAKTNIEEPANLKKILSISEKIFLPKAFSSSKERTLFSAQKRTTRPLACFV